MVETDQQVEVKQEGLTPDRGVEIWEEGLRQALGTGIFISENHPQEAELNRHLKLVLGAIDSGNFNLLERYSIGGDLAGQIREYAHSVYIYVTRLRKREAALCVPGMDPEQVLQGLLSERDMEMAVSGFVPDRDSPLCGRQENEARGAMKVLHDAIEAVRESRGYPIAAIKQTQKEAKAREDRNEQLAHDCDLVISERRDTPVTIASNMRLRELSGQKELEEALKILSGGEVTQVQAAIFRVITKLLFFTTGEQNVFLMREGGLGTDEEIIAELGHRIKCGPFSVPQIEGREVREGTRMEVLEWARGRLTQLRAEIAGKREIDRAVQR